MRFGLDSTTMIAPAEHHKVGSTVALRYLSRHTAKVVTAAEHAAYKAHGIDLILVFEDGARNAWDGYDQGKSDAEFASKQAHDILGTPPVSLTVRFAVDDDAAGNPGATDAYFDGVRAVFGEAHSGPYGSYEVVKHHHDRGFRQIWQTYAWSGGQVFRPAGVYQFSNGHTVGGIGCDFNHVANGDVGQFDLPRIVAPYTNFDSTPRTVHGVVTSERSAVAEYDRLRAHPLIHRHRLGVLRSQLAWFADRLLVIVRSSGGGEAWVPFHRGWRYQQLIHRAQGQRLV